MAWRHAPLPAVASSDTPASAEDFFAATFPSGIASFAPGWALHRARSRALLNAYESAKPSDQRKIKGDNSSADRRNQRAGANLRGIAGALRQIAADLPLIFPVHPRTRANLARFGVDLGLQRRLQ